MVVVDSNTEIVRLMKQHTDVSPFLLKKWERIFYTFFDRNCSHQMDWGDFYLVSRRVRDLYGAESMQYSYARRTLEALWQGLCKLADSDHDELISLDEWVELLKKVDLKNRTEPRWFNDYQTFMFKLFDVSADGWVDMTEYVDGMSIYGYTHEESVDAFKTFAKDAKGKISPEQWKKMFLDLFFSADKSLVGNNLFGRIPISAPTTTTATAMTPSKGDSSSSTTNNATPNGVCCGKQ